MSSLFQLHEFLLNQNYTYVGTLGGDSVLSLRSYLSFTCCWREPTSLDCPCYCFFFSGLDDIFVRNDVWNGPYYWNKEDLPEEWEHIFSFSRPQSEHTQLPEPEAKESCFD